MVNSLVLIGLRDMGSFINGAFGIRANWVIDKHHQNIKEGETILILADCGGILRFASFLEVRLYGKKSDRCRY